MNFFKLKQLFFALKLKRDQKKFIFKKLLYSLFSLPIIFLVQKYQTKKNLSVYRIAEYQNNNYSAEITRDLVSQSSPIRKEQLLFFCESNAEYSVSRDARFPIDDIYTGWHFLIDSLKYLRNYRWQSDDKNWIST